MPSRSLRRLRGNARAAKPDVGARATRMSRTPLYRKEVLETKRNRWLGRLVVRQPMSHWAMTAGAFGIVALLAVFLFVGEYARKVSIAGRLVETADTRGAPGAVDAAPKLEAELLIPERALASVDVGADVLLRFPAYPHQRYGQYRGRVLRISRTPTTGASSGVDANGRAAEARYRAAVALEKQRVRDDRGVERDLRPGLGVMAEIVVEKRPLYRWLFEPLIGFEQGPLDQRPSEERQACEPSSPIREAHDARCELRRRPLFLHA
ncbi:MAG: HlyD family efflux transporter periplasmic adaptor subunit [Lysobacter sp.]|nr:MAG: HlyD family efflux transporter periplasmic adaptor subunit [Lysobacter sp.]